MLLVHGLPVGGTERVVVDLCRWLRHRNVEVMVACLDHLGTFGAMLKHTDGVRCEVLERQPGFDRAIPGRIANLARDFDADLIHAHQYTPYFYAVLAGYRHRVPLLFTEHGRFFPDEPSWKRRLFNRTLGRPVDHVTAVSAGVKEALVQVEGFQSAPIEVLCNGIDLDGFSPQPDARKRLFSNYGIPEDALVLGTLARLDPIKNQQLLVNAFARVYETLADPAGQGPHLLIVGDGECRDALEELVNSLGMADFIHLVGQQQDIPYWLSCMDLFALCSVSEGMPMTLLEAMATRLPIVTTDVGGISAMLKPGHDALFTPSDDVLAFSDAIIRLLTEPDLRKQLGERGHQRVSAEFSLAVIGNRYLGIYEQLTGHTIPRSESTIGMF